MKIADNAVSVSFKDTAMNASMPSFRKKPPIRFELEPKNYMNANISKSKCASSVDSRESPEGFDTGRSLFEIKT